VKVEYRRLSSLPELEAETETDAGELRLRLRYQVIVRKLEIEAEARYNVLQLRGFTSLLLVQNAAAGKRGAGAPGSRWL
jgi:hypothetical protein